MKRITFALGLLVGVSCSRGPLDEDIDGERICREHCELWRGCGMLEATAKTCFDSCMDEDGLGWEGPCRVLRAEYYECSNSLTCEESADDQPDGGVDREDRPCAESRFEYSVCISDQEDR